MDTTTGSTENLETQARRMWTTRPVRLPRSQSPQTWFFGVCEGIAVRYQVSPVLVRLVVGLSVTLGGLGLWFYLVALLVMPRYGVPLSPVEVLLKNERDPRYTRDRDVGVRTLVVGVILLVLGGVGSGGVTLGGVAGGVVATAVVWWLLHQRLPVPPSGLTTPREDAATYQGVDLGSLTPAEGFTPPRTTPPSWDPLGTAPFAWDLPEPPEPAPPAPPRRGPWRRLGGALLGVLLALVLAGAALVAAIGFGVGGVADEDTDTTSTRRFTGSSVVVDSLERDRTVKTLFSDIDVDLGGLRFPTDRKDATVTLESRFSGVDILVPEVTDGASYRLRVDCAQVSASDVDCGRLDGTVIRSTGDRDADPERTLTVEVHSTVSEVRMRQHQDG
ncbi:PspC domain-containing protein [uncultured Corynebacterium sp.]|uniref:PspC domain-containing protein n=1 Tax=uncultured Corynebacterium sp. TaxID=159447 RepID=UPI0025F33883|nr:PspC domain-containing protein [uncultured Corynebacterium sp.]